MKEDLNTQNDSLDMEKVRLKAQLEEDRKSLEEKRETFNTKFDARVKTDKNKDLAFAKEKKSTRTIKNNELEEQWNIRKIEMRKQRDK